MHHPVPEVAFNGEQEFLVAPEDLMFTPLVGETVIYFELSGDSAHVIDTSVVLFPPSVHVPRGDRMGDTGGEERFKPASVCCSARVFHEHPYCADSFLQSVPPCCLVLEIMLLQK